MYGSGDIKPNRLIFLSFWAIFCHFFYPCNSPKNQNIYKRKKKKNAWIYHHFTQVYQNHNPRLYCSWDMAHDGCNYFSFWTIFCSFTAEKIKISKKMKKKKKKTPGNIILHKCTKNHDHMLYYSWNMACDKCNCSFLLWAIFYPFTPLTAPKKKWKKMKKKAFRYHHLTKVYQKSWSYAILLLRYGGWWM